MVLNVGFPKFHCREVKNLYSVLLKTHSEEDTLRKCCFTNKHYSALHKYKKAEMKVTGNKGVTTVQ